MAIHTFELHIRTHKQVNNSLEMEIFGRIGYAVFCLPFVSLSFSLSHPILHSLSLSCSLIFDSSTIRVWRWAMSDFAFTCYLRFCAFRSPLQFHFKFASIIHHNFNDFYRFVSNLFSTKSKLPLPVYLILCIDSASLFRFKGLIWVAKHAKHCKMVGILFEANAYCCNWTENTLLEWI